MNPFFYITAVCFTALNLRCIQALPEYQQICVVTGVMSSRMQLPGYLTADTIVKHGVRVNTTEDVYELRHTAHGTRVIIRMLTCTDEGTYIIGNQTFDLVVIPKNRNVFYFTAKATKRDAALISPLSQVSRISKFYVSLKDDTWNLLEVWNKTMSTRIRPDYCCFMVNNGTTFQGNADDHYKYYVYEIQGSESDTCSTIEKNNRKQVPYSNRDLDLVNIETVETVVNLDNISDVTRDIKKLLDDFEKAWASGGCSSSKSTYLKPYVAITLLWLVGVI